MFRLIRALTVVLAVVTMFQALAVGQSGRTGTSTSQAALTIQVQVVPTAMLPGQPASQTNQSIAYSIPVVPTRLSVIEQKQLINLADPTGKVEPHLVHVTSVVPE